MYYYKGVLGKLVQQLGQLPGIGRRTAERLAFFLINKPENYIREFAKTLIEAKDKIKSCRICGNPTEREVCEICADKSRDASMICVGEEPSAIIAIERSGEYRGLYHCTMGLISPLDGIGPEELELDRLIKRLDEGVEEVILALNPSVEGDTTAHYIHRLVREKGLRTTRIAHGLPAGGELEFADTVTIQQAFQGRREM
jgi:recombination protein RecR